MPAPEPICVLWVCSDCLMAHANGEDSVEDRPASEPEPWAIFPDASRVSMGMLDDNHSCGQSWDDGTRDCGCETDEFSWSPCDGCGSTLGGSRHAFTLWEEKA
jgi:hypothetical protein